LNGSRRFETECQDSVEDWFGKTKIKKRHNY
jgi:hypothetical protein